MMAKYFKGDTLLPLSKTTVDPTRTNPFVFIPFSMITARFIGL